MRIGELAKATHVGVETVRFYERKGLICQPPRPANNGFRSYPQETVSRIRFIRLAQELGFSLDEIDDLFSLKSEPETDCGEVRQQALRKREDVDAKIEQLMQIRETLDTLIDACPGKGTLEFCSILAVLQSDERSGSEQQRTKGNAKS